MGNDGYGSFKVATIHHGCSTQMSVREFDTQLPLFLNRIQVPNSSKFLWKFQSIWYFPLQTPPDCYLWLELSKTLMVGECIFSVPLNWIMRPDKQCHNFTLLLECHVVLIHCQNVGICEQLLLCLKDLLMMHWSLGLGHTPSIFNKCTTCGRY